MEKFFWCLLFIWYAAFSTAESQDFVGKNNTICGKNFTTSSGSFFLNVHTLHNVVTNGTCLFFLQPNDTKDPDPKISLFIHSLFLHPDDKVTVFKFDNSSNYSNDSLSLIDPLKVQNGSIIIFSGEPQLVIKLEGIDSIYERNFNGYFMAHPDCNIPVPLSLDVIHSPIFTHSFTETEQKCDFTFNEDAHHRMWPVLVFEEFLFKTNILSFGKSTADGNYADVYPVDVMAQGQMTMSLTMHPANANETFRFRMHNVDKECTVFKELATDQDEYKIASPTYALNNGSIITECRWIFRHKDDKKQLAVSFSDLHLTNVMDIISVNDGPSEDSTPLMQVTASSNRSLDNQMFWSSQNYMWIAFKPLTYQSTFKAMVTVKAQGGHFKTGGTISLSDKKTDVFYLEVEENKIVLLNFTKSEFSSPGSIKIYDGFETTNKLTTLHGNIWYPILSQSSKMMVVAENFEKISFEASFSGVQSSCLHMSSLTDGNYILPRTCNSSCLWVIPPQEQPGTVLLLHIQYASLNANDQVDILTLDAAKTHIGTITPQMSHVPKLVAVPNVGAIVSVTQGSCANSSEEIVIVGHASYIPVCGSTIAPSATNTVQISSPQYPDTYPVYADCKWEVKAPNSTFVHLNFLSLQLSKDHCVKINNETYIGNELPNDMFLFGPATVQFDSNGCGKKITQKLEASEGFLMNVTTYDCGGLFTNAKGAFNTSAIGNSSVCIFKVAIKETDDNANDGVNIVSFNVTKEDDKSNYELEVYDGASVRDGKLANISGSDIWSRTNNLIFVYRRLNMAQPSTPLVITYNTITCNSSMLCKNNKICLHPDWRCNGHDDCGDFSDEMNCNTGPVDPKVEPTGYTPLAFWLTIFLMFMTGIVIGVVVPFVYQKYKNGPYHRFGDISDIA